MIESYIKRRLKEKAILLMTHIVIGYPSIEESFRIVETMVGAGVDMMELQIPFSEPIADGPIILKANHRALSNGIKLETCLEFAKTVSANFDIPFLFMSYYNPIFRYGTDKFVSSMAKIGIHGSIIPDLPPEEGKDYIKAMNNHNLSPIFIFSPNTTDNRMKYIASFGKGFIYCVARRGVTGDITDFSQTLSLYLNRCRSATSLPLAVGFGVKEKEDIEFLKEKADIAVIGTQAIRIVKKEGLNALKKFIEGLY